MVIYKITNLINGKCYIGQTTQKVEQRWNEHKSVANLKHKRGYNSILYNALRKYGKHNFTFEILDTTDSLEKLNKLEIYYIDKFNSISPKGYNIELGGKNKKCAESTKLKISIANSKPVIARHKNSTKEIYFKSIAEAARFGFEESAIRQCLKGKFSKHKNHYWYRPGEKPKKLLSKYEKDSKAIIAHNDIEKIEFPSLREAERKGFNRRSIVRAINNSSTFKHYKWNYKK